jgi:hypothetical protein
MRRQHLVIIGCCVSWAGCDGCLHFGFGPIEFDGGSRGCGSTNPQPCNRVDEIVPHGHIAQRWWFGGCMAWCDDGYYDCNGNLDDGCESTTACNASQPPPQAFVHETALSGDPEGLALCTSVTVVIADGHLLAMLGVDGPLVPIATVLSPAGGIACDDFTAYYGQAGGIVVASGTKIVEGGTPELLAAGDPARGILVDTSSVYWRAAADGGALLMRSDLDGATTSVASMDPSIVDLPFALGPTGPWVVAGGGVSRIDDAGATTLLDGDAGVVAIALSDARAAVATSDDSGIAIRDFDLDGGLGDAQLTGDVRAVVAAGADVFVATSDEIWRLPSGSAPEQIAKGQNDIADLAVNDTWIAWTSRGDRVVRAVHR